MSSILQNSLQGTLPLSASRFQRDFDQSIGPRLSTQQTVASIPGIKYNPPDFMLPWLIWEYGLEQLLPYLTDPRLAIQEGVRWQRIRGTPRSLSMALGWLDFSDIEIEPEVPGEHFYQYQIDTGQIVPTAQLDNVRAVAKFSAPLRSRLSRLYHGYDVRRLRLDESDYGALLSDYSGIRKDGIVLSFGRQHSFAVDMASLNVDSAHISARSTAVRDVHWPTLDNELLGGYLTQVARTNHWTSSATPQGSPWLGHWDARTWGESSYPLIATKTSALFVRHHDNDTVIDSPITHLSISFNYALDAQLNHEKAEMGKGADRYLELDAGQQPALNLTNSIRFNVQAIGVLPHGLTWLGHWDSRAWQQPEYATIGIQNNAMPTHYNMAYSQWLDNDIGGALEQARSQAIAIEAKQLDVKQHKLHDLSTNATVDAQQANSIRLDSRISDVTALSQFWLGPWDTRAWDQTNTALVGFTHYTLNVKTT